MSKLRLRQSQIRTVYALNDVKTGDCLYAENDSIRDCVYADQTQEISDLAKKEDH